jgi:glycosyltransferase involved in cell wall biosynthesis
VYKNLLVSPSGNFYGSEQVLTDYLELTSKRFDVAVPKETKFHTKLLSLPHQVIPFSNLKVFYLKVFLWLLFGKYKNVYVNEAGHSRYIHMLATIFRKVRFVIHVRLLEDTMSRRWSRLQKRNTVLISISDYIQQNLEHPSELVYDLYNFPGNIVHKPASEIEITRVAVIGRISYSKGFRELVELVRELERQGKLSNFILNLYGDLIDEVKNDPGLGYLQSKSRVVFKGFVPNDVIYNHSDIVLHLSKTEPLGRIYFESISSGVPLIGFNTGGIGEIAIKTGLEEFVVDPGAEEARSLIEKMEWVRDHFHHVKPKMDNAMADMKIIFCRSAYTKALDDILSR